MPRLACPSWRWITTSGTPSCAISTAWACRSWCGANRRLTPAAAAAWCSCLRAADASQRRPAVGPWITHSSAPIGSSPADLEPRLELLPRPAVHPDLASLAALPAPDKHRAARAVEVALLERERLADPQPGTPEQDDQRAESLAVGAVADGAHDRDDLLDGRRVCRVLLALVARRAAAVVAGHRRRRAAVAGGIQQDGLHEFLPCGWMA